MRKFKMGIRRFGASFAALLMVCCLTAPALAYNWPSSPSSDDFASHPNCWYVWNSSELNGYKGFELICYPMIQFSSSNTQDFPFDLYSTNSFTYSYTNSAGAGRVYMCSFPYIPASPSASWTELPSFPVGEPSRICGAVRLYPCITRDYLASVDDVFSDRSVFGF